MKWAGSAKCIALVALLMAVGACGSFGAANTADPMATDGGDGADAAAACVLEPCADAGPSCSVHDFAKGCGSEFGFSGNTDMPGVIGTCAGGKAHIAADGTLDIIAELAAQTPGQYDAVRVSARIAVKDWDGGRLLTVQIDRQYVVELRAVLAASGRPRFSLCDASGTCAAQTFDANADQEHTFVLDITRTSVALSVDCAPLATFNATIGLTPRAGLVVDFGHTDAEPIDGTLDDLSVSFR